MSEHSLVGVERHDKSKVKLPGAVFLKAADDIETVEDWAEFYGVEQSGKTKLVVYKLVGDELKSGHGMEYPVGREVVAPDWDKTPRCGHGLHFSPSPSACHRYSEGTRYLACEVKSSEVVLLGDKIKSRSCRVLYEVDADGEQIESPGEVAA